MNIFEGAKVGDVYLCSWDYDDEDIFINVITEITEDEYIGRPLYASDGSITPMEYQANSDYNNGGKAVKLSCTEETFNIDDYPELKI